MKKNNYIRPGQDKPENFSEDQKKNIGSNNPFKVPEQYFNKLPDQIQNKLTLRKLRKAKHSGLLKPLTYLTATAAAIIIILFIYSVLIPNKTQETQHQYAFNNFENTITEYLEDKIEENTLIEMSSNSLSIFDFKEIPDITRSENPNTLAENIDHEFEFDSSINKNDIIEYFITENIDPEITQ